MTFNDYNEYFCSWKSGIKNEVEFWDKLFKTSGRCGGNEKVFSYRLDPLCKFSLASDLDSVDGKIIDIGSGPYSNLGFCVENERLNITLVDPLAASYRKIGKKYGIQFPIEPQTGMVELLHLLYEQNEFDFVHMSNSLDHCFDPIRGIFELIYISKVGGKIILRHNDNEAERANYKGFHQWNLTLRDGRFAIWRRNEDFIFVDEIIKDYAKVEFAGVCSEKLFDDNWTYNKVVIRKTRELDENKFLDKEILISLLDTIIEKCSEVI